MLNKDKNKMSKFLVSKPSAVAKNIVKSVENKKEIYYPFKWKIIMLIIKLIPEKLFKALNFNEKEKKFFFLLIILLFLHLIE